jgi:hypothetical protein
VENLPVPEEPTASEKPKKQKRMEMPSIKSTTPKKQSLTSRELQREIIMSIFVNGDPNTVLRHLRSADRKDTAPPTEFSDDMDAASSSPSSAVDLILDDKNQTALHYAASFARIELLHTLLLYNANIRSVNINGETPLIRAVQSVSCFDSQVFPDVLDLLGPVIRSADDNGHTVLHWIALKSGMKDHVSASIYYLRCVVNWIEEGGLEILGGVVAAAASGAVGQEHQEAKTPKAMTKKLVSLLVNAQDGEGNTALHLAVKSRCRPVVSMLVKLGADRMIKNYDELTSEDLAKGDGRIVEAVRGVAHSKVCISTCEQCELLFNW